MIPEPVSLKEFLETPFPFTEESAWGVLEHFYEDLQNLKDEHLFSESRYDRTEILKTLEVLLTPRWVERRLQS
jgi:hypothetical protein